MRKITEFIIHCSATREGQDVTAADIRRWHVQGNGWSDIGYHFVIRLDGRIELGRPIAQVGAHCAGHNAESIGICYVGGLKPPSVPPRGEDWKFAKGQVTTPRGEDGKFAKGQMTESSCKEVTPQVTTPRGEDGKFAKGQMTESSCKEATPQVTSPRGEDGKFAKGQVTSPWGGREGLLVAADTRTPEQKAAMMELLRVLHRMFPEATVHGHREYARKACPCFDVKELDDNM